MINFCENLIILFSGMLRSCIGRSALLCRQGKDLSAIVSQYLSNFSDTVFSRFTSLFSRKRTAFTLAEVLITLGIIGIVAALTLPTLTSRYQEKVFITKLEKTYSILVSAYKLAVEENVSSTAWVLVNKNMDYIRCRGELDWEEQTSCPKK